MVYTDAMGMVAIVTEPVMLAAAASTDNYKTDDQTNLLA